MKTKEPKPLHNHRLGNRVPMVPIKDCIQRSDHNLLVYSPPIGAKLKGTMVSVSVSGRIFFLSEAGHLYDLRKGRGISIIEKKEIACYLSQNEMRALQRLGLFSGKEVTAIVKAEKERQQRRDKDRKIESFLDHAKAVGIAPAKAKKLLTPRP